MYLDAVSTFLASSAGLRQISEKFIPAYRNFFPGFSLVGFVVPLIAAIVSCALLYPEQDISFARFKKSAVSSKFWIICAVLSVVTWYLTPGFASGGHTDFPFAVVVSIYAGWNWKSADIERSVLRCIVLGFLTGLVSDLQSQTFFVGIFGGWGLLDGDLVGTLTLPLAALTAETVMKRLNTAEGLRGKGKI